MSQPLQLGAIVSERYEIAEQIGSGGHGVVYRARDRSLDRDVALKVLHRELMGDAVEARFIQEARLSRQLQHPHTVRLLDFGRDQTGVFYIAYELLEGVSLDQATRRQGPMDQRAVAHIAVQVLKSLLEAHELGVVHRDIKPSNVFLCRYSGERFGFVKVLDFGIAKSSEDNNLTVTGSTVGTANYMAPEQVRGEGVCAATDLYALGLTMAEALSGDVVVRGLNPALIALEQVSDASVTLPAAALRSPLAPIIHRATQKDLTRRYASAAEMLADIEQLQLGPSTGELARPNTQAPVVAEIHRAHTAVAPMAAQAKRARSGGWLVLTIALAALALIMGVAMFSVTTSESAKNDTAAATPSFEKKKKKKRKKRKKKKRKKRKKKNRKRDLG